MRSRASTTRNEAGAVPVRRGGRSSRRRSGGVKGGSCWVTSTSGSTSSARRRCAQVSRLSTVTARLVDAAGLVTRILPATDDALRTLVVTPAGTFAFQEWFVARRHEDEVDAMAYEGADAARAAPGVLDAIDGADVVVVAPSNPYTSHSPHPGGGGGPGCARLPAIALDRREPVDRWPCREGAARPYAHPHGRRNVTSGRGTVLSGT